MDLAQACGSLMASISQILGAVLSQAGPSWALVAAQHGLSGSVYD
jgi:hypothetical protein